MSDAMKQEIIELYQNGTSQEEIAAIMRVSIDTVCDITDGL